MAGAAKQDHHHAATPGDAIAMGADYLVVGRPLRDAGGREERRRAATAIIDEMAGALKKAGA